MDYSDKTNCYFEHQRDDLTALIPKGQNRILDIGAASGNIGQALKQSGKAKEVIGIELNENAAEAARTKIDKVICGDIEKLTLSFPYKYFDYILFGDVLEHLVDPWTTLVKLKEYLADDGNVIASIPNIRNWRIIKDLIFNGKWEYQKEGILDKTHLRFFTRKSIKMLFSSSGYKIQETRASWTKKRKSINLITLCLFEDFLIGQFLIVASKR